METDIAGWGVTPESGQTGKTAAPPWLPGATNWDAAYQVRTITNAFHICMYYTRNTSGEKTLSTYIYRALAGLLRSINSYQSLLVYPTCPLAIYRMLVSARCTTVVGARISGEPNRSQHQSKHYNISHAGGVEKQ